MNLRDLELNMSEKPKINITSEDIGKQNKPEVEVKRRNIEVEVTPRYIWQVERIQEPGTIDASKKEDLKKNVEVPLLAACELLYDLNIKTTMSSANRGEIRKGAYIRIDFNSLSTENKKIAKQMVLQSLGEISGDQDKKDFRLVIKMKKDSLVRDIQKKALDMVSRFEKQKMTWVDSFSLQEVEKRYGIPNEKRSKEEWIKAITDYGGYYDQEDQMFYPSKEQYEKANEKI